MPRYPQLVALVVIALVPILVTLIALNVPSTPLGWGSIISSSVTAVSVALTLFHFGLWRYLPDFLAPRPDLNGTWKVIAQTWPGLSNSKPEVFSGYMVVKQHYFSLSMRLETALTCSELVAEQITQTKAGVYQLWAIYYCEPRPGVDPGRIRPHYGALMLRIVQDEGLRLEGRYWIDGELMDGGGVKLQDGRIDLTDRKWEYYQNYEAALRGFGEPASESTQMQSSAS